MIVALGIKDLIVTHHGSFERVNRTVNRSLLVSWGQFRETEDRAKRAVQIHDDLLHWSVLATGVPSKFRTSYRFILVQIILWSSGAIACAISEHVYW